MYSKRKESKKKKGKLSDQVKISWKEKYLWAITYNSDFLFISLQESNFYKVANRHFEDIERYIHIWLNNVEASLFSKNGRQKVLDAMKGKEPEGKLIDLLPTDKMKNNFQATIKSCFLEESYTKKSTCTCRHESRSIPESRRNLWPEKKCTTFLWGKC